MTSQASDRVLVLEDNRDVRETLQAFLQLEGYDVETAENGKDGLERMRAGFQPGLIVLDLMMPVMDGAQFRREQLADPVFATIPVVVCSALFPDEVEAQQRGAVAYVKKPVDVDALLSTIRTLIHPPTAPLPSQASAWLGRSSRTEH